MGLARAADRGLRRLRRQVPRRGAAGAEPRGRRRRGGPRAPSQALPPSGVRSSGRRRDASCERRRASWRSSRPPRRGRRRSTWRCPGAHNVLNARAALAALGAAGFDLDRAAAALADFRGVRRRLEVKGERGGVRIYDDYAHHPTEVRAALSALRDLDPPRLVAVFQPHLYSRTKVFATEFGAALALADEIAVLDVYPAREEPVGPLAGVSGLDVARAAADRRRRQTSRLAPDRRQGRGFPHPAPRSSSLPARSWSRSAPATSSSWGRPSSPGDRRSLVNPSRRPFVKGDEGTLNEPPRSS